MIVKTTAIPLACYPVANTSQVVHWLTNRYGKISTMLKGALRPKSAFSGGYSLFSTSELLFYDRGKEGLFTAKECSFLHPRPQFRSDWRAMLAASHITALFSKTTPEYAPQPKLLDFYEELLDLAVEYGRYTPFIYWAELRFCDWHGHAPHLRNCIHCASENHLRFAAALGGTVCTACTKQKQIPTLDCPPDILAALRNLQQSKTPNVTKAARFTLQQTKILNRLLNNFTTNQLDIFSSLRHKRLL